MEDASEWVSGGWSSSMATSVARQSCPKQETKPRGTVESLDEVKLCVCEKEREREREREYTSCYIYQG